MNNNSIEMLKRLKKAAGYQKKAIQALFPDMMNEHFEVIENEFKLMMIEAMGGIEKTRKKKVDHFKGAFAGGFACNFADDENDTDTGKNMDTGKTDVDTGKKSGARKVTIS